MTRKRLLAGVAGLMLLVPLLAACPSSDQPDKKSNGGGRAKAVETNKKFPAPDIHNYVEYNNYVKKYKLDDDPASIKWCTFSWNTANAPLVTVPIAGKLTSSSVSLFPSSQAKVQSGGGDGVSHTTYNPELPQADGMFHGSPPPYRYGFTPGGQYVDFTNVAVFCTTALTKFQKDKTEVDVSYDSAASHGTTAAEQALKQCQAQQAKGVNATVQGSKCAAAQKALEDAVGGK